MSSSHCNYPETRRLYSHLWRLQTTVNQVSKLDSYPIPKVEDLLATLGGGEKFTKLERPIRSYFLMKNLNTTPPSTYTKDCSSTTICPTEYRHHRNLLHNIPYVIVRVDDILVSRTSDKDHLNNVEEVYKPLASAGLRKSGKRVCVHGTSSNLPGSQGQQGRHSTFARQGRCFYQCTSCLK